MITCPQAGFFFVHIPKNGGSSVRDQIQSEDVFDGQFLGTKQHPELGFYDSSHVPLEVLRRHFPEAFSTISGLDGYCIMRDPLDRFSSSIAQRFRQIHKRRPDEVTAQDVRDEVTTVIAHLDEQGDTYHHKFSHFIPQADFIELDGSTFVRNIYHIRDTPRLLRALSDRLGKPLVEDFHSNKTVTFRHDWMARPAIYAKNWLKSVAPAPVVDRVRKLAMGALTKPRVQIIDDEIRNSDTIRDFIRETYARDYELLSGLRTEQIAP